ncbi:MAG: multiheme c-type cytochrome [Planctomycetota bacterium]
MGGIARKNSWLIAFVAILCALAVSLASLPAGMNSTFRSVVHADPKGIKYLGSGSCGGNGCHGEDVKKPKPTAEPGHDELTIWQQNDGHARAFEDKIKKRKGLLNKDSDKIAAAMKLGGKASESGRCLSCHGLTGFSNGEVKARIPLDFAKDVAAEDIAKERFKVSDGVSCDACHGPSEKFNTPHREKGWTAKMRAGGSAKLFDELGLYNTKDLHMRANLCVSCHLRIDPDMIAAGHPEPTFELDSMSHGKWMHWRPNGDYFGAKAWAMGQFACAREAALQLADRLKGKADAKLVTAAYNQMISHVLTSSHAAKFVSADLATKLMASLTAINGGWADAAKTEAELHNLAKTADALCEELNKQIGAGFKGKEFTDEMLKGIAAEAEVAGKLGFQAGLQFSYAMTALSETEMLGGAAPDADPDAMKKVAAEKGGAKFKAVGGVQDTVSDPAEFKADDFTGAAKKLAALFPGGAAIPLPAGGPTK